MNKTFTERKNEINQTILTPSEKNNVINFLWVLEHESRLEKIINKYESDLPREVFDELVVAFNYAHDSASKMQATLNQKEVSVVFGKIDEYKSDVSLDVSSYGEIFRSTPIEDNRFDYVFHQAQYVQTFEINGKSFDAVFNTGNECENNDLRLPLNTLTLEQDEADGPLFYQLSMMTPEDFDDNELIDQLNEMSGLYLSGGEWSQVSDFVFQHSPTFEDAFDNISEDIDDYDIEKVGDECIATPKKQKVKASIKTPQL